MLGVVVGGRLGYCLFYKPGFYLENPLQIFFVWQGGMSFHGGLIGVIVSQIWFARSRHKPFWQVMDFVAPCVPTGLAAGRVGNFINGELWGRLADPSLPWAMVFPQAGPQPRHPSQVYQFLMEGVLQHELKHKDQAEAAFRNALGRDSDAQLPVLSPTRSLSAFGA